MAKEEKKEAAHHEDAAPEAKKSNKLLIIIIAVILVLILAAAGAIAMILMKDDDHAQQNQQQGTHQVEQQAEHTAPAQKPKATSPLSEDSRKFSEIGILFPLDTFTVNLKSDSGKRYLKATISLELEGKELGKELTSKIAVIRDRIIKILSSKTVEEISSQKGKQKVTEQVMETLNAMITDGSIKGVYFTEFVIQ